MKKTKYYLKARSAITGRFVSLAYAKSHRSVTVVYRVRRL
jgi:hypothetical protein